MRWPRPRQRVRRAARTPGDFAAVLVETIPPVLLGERHSVRPDQWSALLSTTARLTPAEARALYAALTNVALGSDKVTSLGAVGPTAVQHRERFLRSFVDDGPRRAMLAGIENPIDVPVTRRSGYALRYSGP